MDVVNALAESWPRRAPMRPPFAEVAREHLDDVFRYLVFLTADPVLAEDLTGETFENAFRSWKRFDPRRGSERTWLCQLARSKALDHFVGLAGRRADHARARRGGHVVHYRHTRDAGTRSATLRISVGRVQDAVFRLTQLGTVTAQKVNTEDLQSPVDLLDRRIAHVRSQIRIELARIASGMLDPVEELQARVHLENLRRNLGEAKQHREAILRQTTMADLMLRLAAPAPGAVEKSESGVSGAANKVADFLSGAGAVAVFLALVLSPLILLVVLAWLALRVRNRRVEARLLDDPRPGASTPPT